MRSRRETPVGHRWDPDTGEGLVRGLTPCEGLTARDGRVIRTCVATVLVACVLAIFGLVLVPARAQADEAGTWDFLGGARVAMLTGAPFEDAVYAANPDVEEVLYFATMPDTLAALRARKADALVNNEAVATLATRRYDDLAVAPEPLVESRMGIAFPKGSPYHDEFAEVIGRMAADGTADVLWDKWTGPDEAEKTVPAQTWPGARGTLRVAACQSLEPISYLAQEGMLGFDIETLLEAARELDYHLEFVPMEFAEVMAHIQSDKADMACGSILVTEERQQTLDFAVTHDNDLVVVVRNEDAPAAAPDVRTPVYATIDELRGKTVGMGAGSVFDQLIEQYAEGIDDFRYFMTYSDLLAALRSGKVDAFVADEPTARLLVSRNQGIALLPEPLVENDYGFALSKGNPLTDRLDEIIHRFASDGTLDELKAKWCDSDESEKTMPAQDWDTSGGTLRVALDCGDEPISYLRGREIVGYDAELVMLCARELHMGVVLQNMNFDSSLASVQSGKSDIAVGGISITPERAQAMSLTVPVYYGSVTFVVKAREQEGPKSFFDGLAESFRRTFIVEDRWKLILDGLGVTVLVSVASGLLGTGLGFLSMLARRKGNRVARLLVGAFEGLMGRLPIVVVLMVFYYVIFGSLNIPGTVVAITVFTLAFGASAGSTMWNAVEGIEVGQTEATLALGFDDNQAFFGIVLPQATRRFLPLLSGQFVSLVKDTSVVGYIAVTDLTRAGDLIRARTMEAFFPLFATAAIYFALCCVLAWLMGILTKRLDLSRRSRTIKGVEL